MTVKSAGAVAGRIPTDWRERFSRSCDLELQEWVDAVAAGSPAQGRSAWDGFVAQVVCDAALHSLHHGGRVAIELPPRPDLSAPAGAR